MWAVTLSKSAQPAFTQLRRLILLWLSCIQLACLEHATRLECGVEGRVMNTRRCVELIPTTFYAGARKHCRRVRFHARAYMMSTSRLTQLRKGSPRNTVLRKCVKAVPEIASAGILRTASVLPTL